MERSSAIPLQAVFLAVGLGFALAACSAPAPEPSAGPATDSATTAPDTAGPEAGAASGSAGPVPADAAEDTPPDQQARCTTHSFRRLVLPQVASCEIRGFGATRSTRLIPH